MTVEMPHMPPRIAALPRDPEGFPIPWFAQQLGGGVSFAIMPAKLEAVKLRRCCWICGQPMGVHKVFTLGPLGCLTQACREPPSHLACAAFTAVYPFAVEARTDARAAAAGQPPPDRGTQPPPQLIALWTTPDFSMQALRDRDLYAVGPPSAISWYREGRAATYMEVVTGVAGAAETLKGPAEKEGRRAMLELLTSVRQAMAFFPRPEEPETPEELEQRLVSFLPPRPAQEKRDA